MLFQTFTLFSLISAITATPIISSRSDFNSTCGVKEQRKGWHNMTDIEKSAYINADLCLMNSPSKTQFPGAKTRWDDLQYVHINLTNIIHGCGGFLPWHRYYMYTHMELLKNECNYTGFQPYWEESLDTLPSPLSSSPIFDPLTGFGGNGVGDLKCVIDGPFANTTLHYGPIYEQNDLCLARNFSSDYFQWANETYLDEVWEADTYEVAWQLLSAKPHTAAHMGVGNSVGNGTMFDQACSPGDPLFFLHHTNLDRLWWQWQSMNLSSRLTDMSGSNRPKSSWIDEFDLGFVGAEWFDYDGDNGGNVTTLKHTLTVLGLVPNATVEDVMDIGSGLLCYEYV